MFATIRIATITITVIMSMQSLPVIDLDIFLSEAQESDAAFQECKKASPDRDLSSIF